MTNHHYDIEQVGGMFHLLKLHEGTDEIVGVYETLRQAETEMHHRLDEDHHGK